MATRTCSIFGVGVIGVALAVGCGDDRPSFSTGGAEEASGGAGGSVSAAAAARDNQAELGEGGAQSSMVTGPMEVEAGAATRELGEVDAVRCGDGVVQLGEECDEGSANSDALSDTCRSDCRRPSCGDGAVDLSLGEQCDDGAENADGVVDACSTRCKRGCGNGVVDSAEECDEGPANDDTRADACRTDCSRPTCGDGVIDPSSAEACDEAADNSDSAPSACRLDCTKHRCGDGVIDLDEGCDDGAANGADGSTCDSSCVLTSCGDGVEDPGEECDLGEGNSDSTAGGCRTNCRTGTCGDGAPDPAEECDDGPDNSNTQPDACRTNCQGPTCGDDVVDPSNEEECDGATACSADCKSAECGNGRRDPGETCDPPDGTDCDDECQVVECGDGKLHSSEACEPTGEPDDDCTDTCSQVICGDSKVEGSEQCDGGPDLSDPNCNASCQRPACGNRTIEGTEVCDDGVNTGMYGGCNAGCMSKAPFCGDGVVQAGNEQCDLGMNNADSPPYGGCDKQCRRGPHCGDGELASNEECDEGSNNSDNPAYGGCDKQCAKGPHCGDGKQDPGEVCDAGPENGKPGVTCNASCSSKVNACGDAVLDMGEQCDKGAAQNDGSYGGCTNQCTLAPFCGDMKLEAGKEECDNGSNNKATPTYNECTAGTCTRGPFCGDGSVTNGEKCDEGPTGNQGGYNRCKSDCTLDVRCGDGVVQSSEEACDDGKNGDDADGCRDNCGCSSTYALCDGACVDPSTSDEFCGANHDCEDPGFDCSTESWTCVYGRCSAPEWSWVPGVKGGTGSVRGPRVGLDANGRGIVAWREYVSSTDVKIFGNVYDPSDGWGTPKQLASLAQDPYDLELAVSPHGEAILAWVQGDEVAAGFFNGTSWSALGSVGDNTDSNDVDVSINSDGDGVIVWENDDEARMVRVSSSGVQSQTETVSNTGLSRLSEPSVGIAGTKVALAWEERAVSGEDIRTQTRFFNSTWGLLLPLSSTGVNASDPRIGMLSSTGAHAVIWKEPGGLYAYYHNGSAWNTKATLDLSNTIDEARLVSNSNGVAYAMWNTGETIHADRFTTSNKAWGGGKVVAITANANDAAIAVNKRGDGLIAYEGELLGDQRVMVSEYTSSWGALTPLPTDKSSVSDPHAALNDSAAMVVWTSGGELGAAYRN